MKQFVLVCDDKGMEAISRVCNGTVQFLEIQGMNVQDRPLMILTTPIVPAIDQTESTTHDI